MEGINNAPFRGLKLKIILPKVICIDREIIEEKEKNLKKNWGMAP